MMLEELREQVWRGNLALPEHGLVAWTGGNLSAITEDRGRIVIKPSRMLYPEMRPEDMGIVDLSGKVVDGERGPSSDTASHLAIYQGRSDVVLVVHTHSAFAMAFAALGKPIPCCLTAIADEFGDAVPCADYARIGSDEIGQEIFAAIGQSPAVLAETARRLHNRPNPRPKGSTQPWVGESSDSRCAVFFFRVGFLNLPGWGSDGGGRWSPPQPR